MSVRGAVQTFRGYRVPEFRLIEHWRWWFALSGAVLTLSLVGLLVRGLNLSIDFEGGALLTYPNEAGVTVSDVQDLLAERNVSQAEVQIVGDDQISIRTESLSVIDDRERAGLLEALADQAGTSAESINRQDVGPTWGSEISRKALIGLVIVLAAITLYITLRFEWKMAIGAQVAMVHDVLVTAGVYALVGREVTPATVIAILTILGFSLYDTVVIFDKVKENTESQTMLSQDTYSGVANASLNQVLMRSVNTSLVVVFPVLSLLFFGGETLKDFAFAMFIGVLTGAYSSIFVGTPILALLKEREPRYKRQRARLEARAAAGRGPGAVVERVATGATDRAPVRRPSGRRPQAKRKRR